MNLLTFDIEDWYHPTLAYKDFLDREKIEHRVVEPTLRIINMLEETNNKATFFVLGEVAAKFPELVQEIVRTGHEVASHGYSHNLVYSYTKYQFETDIRRSLEVLETATNKKVLGYRAPSWSLNEKTPWAWEVLNASGFKYDSSMYPFKTYLYGDNNSPRFEYEIELENGDRIKEIPPSAVEILGRRFPFAGGFFLRVVPTWCVNWGIRQYNALGRPAVVYLHPWEIDVNQPRLDLDAKERFIMYANLAKTESKLARLLARYKFDSIGNCFSFSNSPEGSLSKVLLAN